MVHVKKETTNLWQYKLGNIGQYNANIANFVYL